MMKYKRVVFCAAVTFFAACAIFAADAPKKKTFTDPREQLKALGVEDKYFERLADEKRISTEERETLLRLMFRLRIFPPVDLNRWAMDPEQLQTAIEHPQDYRGMIFRLKGQIVDVRPHEPSPEDAKRYEMRKFYLCKMKLEDTGKTVIIFTEHVPQQWQKGATPNTGGGVLGVFLKLIPINTPVFVAPRLAWYPDDLLGKLGMDVGLLDTVVNVKEDLSEEDRPAFYDMLAAVGRTKPGELLKKAEENLSKIPAKWRWVNDGREAYSVVPLFNDVVKHFRNQQGRLVALRGETRLVEKVYVEPEIAAQYGFDHYYNVMLVTDDSQGNPLTFCIRELPEGMPEDNKPGYAENVYVAGFYFKTWGYPVRKSPDEASEPGESKTRIQLSPLLIGRSLVWRPPPPPVSQKRLNIIIGGIFVAAMLVIWFVAWRSMRRERSWVDKTLSDAPMDFTPPDEKQ